MNYLKRCQENYYANYCQNNGIVFDIIFCCRVAKRREYLHHIFSLLKELNVGLPSLEICDLMKAHVGNSNTLSLFTGFPKKKLMKMIGYTI
jgi:hypothetical protein